MTNSYSDFKISYHDIKNSNAIFKIVTRLIEKHDSSRVVLVIFDDTVNEINPLLFIVLLAEIERKKKKLFIDIRQLNSFKQSAVQHFLRQQLDLGKFDLLIKEKYEELDPNIILKNSIVATEDATQYAIAFNLSKQDGYHFLPIMTLRGLPEIADRYNFDYKTELERLTGKDARKAYYSAISVDSEVHKNPEKYHSVLKFVVERFFKFFKLKSEKLLIDNISEITYEMIDNIIRHTESQANGYVLFYKTANRDKKNIHNIFICDNDERGFLNTYITTLKHEIAQIAEINIDEVDIYCKNICDKKDNNKNEIVCGYAEELQLLLEDLPDNDKLVLKNLYSSDGTFASHQIPRIVMHFGIPMLIDTVENLNGSIEIWIHKKTKYEHEPVRYYKIKIMNGKTTICQVHNRQIMGTFISIKIPEQESKEQYIGNEVTVNHDLEIEEYKYALLNKNEIDSRVLSFTEVNDQNSHSNNKIFDYKKYTKKYPGKTISDGLRDIYKLSYKKEFKNILVINFPLKTKRHYIETLIKILYKKDNLAVSRYPINIIFMEEDFGMVFIGGKDRQEFCISNRIIGDSYAYQEVNFELCTNLDKSKENPSDSDFFYKDSNNKWHIIPLSNFDNVFSGEKYYNQIEKRDLHVDVGGNKHIGRFFNIKKIIENSLWDKKIAYHFANKLFFKYPDKDIVFIGMGKYAAITISRIQMIMGIEDRFFIYNNKSNKDNIEEKRQADKLKKFISNLDNKKNIVIFVPVMATSNGIGKLTKLIEGKQKKVINTIRFEIDDVANNIYVDSFLTITKDQIKLQEAEKCKFCFSENPENEKPLYLLNDSDFYLQSYYKDDFVVKDWYKHKKKPNTLSEIDWKDIVFTGHIEKSNHYYFYINTINLLENNINLIKSWIKSINYFHKHQYSGGKDIVFAPIRDSNNKFIVMIEEYLFGGNATVYRFDRKLIEQNYYDLESLNIQEYDRIYFVDDEVDTGATIEYFYSLLRKKYPNKKFYKIITLLDRTLQKDLDYIGNTLEGDIDHNYFPFVSTDIAPIKTSDEICFLCNRRDQYIQLFQNSIIDMTRFQFLERIIKLQSIESYEAGQNLAQNTIKNFIKFYMTELMYKNKFTYDEKDFKNLLMKIGYAYKKDIEFLENELSKEEYQVFRITFFKSIQIEFEIAYLKVLSFPKIAYNERARAMITRFIIIKLQGYVNEKTKDLSEKVFKINDDLKSKIEVIDNKGDIYRFIKFERREIDYVNVLISTAGYLDIKYLLHKDMIDFYRLNYIVCGACVDIKDKTYIYPFSVKMITFLRESSAKELDKNIKKILSDNLQTFGMDEYTKIRAMYLENILMSEQNMDLKQDDNMDNFFNKIKNISITTSKEHLTDKIKSIELYVNQNYTIEYKSYESYMKKSKLINLNTFEVIDETLFKHEYMVYSGVISKEDDSGVKKEISIDYNNKDDYSKLRDVWANWYIDDDKKLIIRLVDIDIRFLDVANRDDCLGKFDDNQIELMSETKSIKPIGVLSIEVMNDSEDIVDVTRALLGKNREIVDYIRGKFSTGVIHEAIKNKEAEHSQKLKAKLVIAQNKNKYSATIEELRKEKKDLQEEINNYVVRISNVGHNYSENIKIMSKINDMQEDPNISCDQILELVKYYTHGLEFIFNSASLGSSDKTTKVSSLFFSIKERERESFKYRISKFIESTPYFIDTGDYKKQVFYLETFEFDSNDIEFNISTRQLQTIIYEIVYNAAKSNSSESTEKLVYKIIAKDQKLYIANNGEEIPKEKQRTLFNRDPDDEKHGNGLPTIYDLLDMAEMSIEFLDENSSFPDEYKVIFKIGNKG